jgi:hypothetical protein
MHHASDPARKYSVSPVPPERSAAKSKSKSAGLCPVRPERSAAKSKGIRARLFESRISSAAFFGLVFAVIIATVARVEGTGAISKAKPTRSCGSAPYRQFDFFAGDWDTYDLDAPSKVVARNQVTIILDGCVIQEDYRQNDGVHGESFSVYDATRDMWHQTWVTNRGKLLQLDGRLVGDRMILTGRERATDGTSSLLRGIWHPEAPAVRETAERSIDGGKTWKPVFDIVFRPHLQDGR